MHLDDEGELVLVHEDVGDDAALTTAAQAAARVCPVAALRVA